MKFVVALGFALWAIFANASAEEAYQDNRSDPESLIRSLYSAINHHEYARAWSYYADPPAKDFATYSKGFETTAHVDVLIGEVSGDGAAGSIFFNVPVAIRAKNDNGKVSSFAGCYVLRQVNGAIQEPPFTPLHIQSAKLKPIKADDFTRYSLPKCGDPPADASNTASTIDTAKAKFIVDAKGECDKVADTQAGLNEPQTYVISYKGKDASPGQPENKATLYAFSCTMAAYNETSVFYLDAGALGLARVSFARPHLDISYGDAENTKLKSMRVTGFEAASELTNAEFDPKTNSISEIAKWRGLADASSSGTWAFMDGQFVLQDFAVDPTYDEKQNPIDIFAKGKIVLKP
jgi:hypothetical protein